MMMKGLRGSNILVAALVLIVALAGCSFGSEPASDNNPVSTESEMTETEKASLAAVQSEQKQDQIEKAQSINEEPVEESQEITIDIESEDSGLGDTEGEGQIEAVEPPKNIDLIFFMGQSNMSGCGGDFTQAPAVIPGAGYEFRAVSDPFALHDITEPFGISESIPGAIWDVPGAKKGSLVSAFVNEYYNQTGRCVIAVSASAGGTTTANWLSAGFVTDISLRLKNAQTYLNDNGYTIDNQYVVWLQGESDALHKTNVEVYQTNMDDIMRPMFIGGCSKVFIITPGQINTNSHFFDNIIDCQIEMCKESGYYALASTILCGVPVSHMVDEWHYDQKVLNMVGEDAADAVAYYTNNDKEKCIYDYKHDTTFIPNFFDYSDSETADKKDIEGILAQ